MKKSQVLAALALAFALGVTVIPSASTYAAMVKIDDKGALVTDKDMTKKMNKAIEDGKASCGWHLEGTGSSAVMKYYYDQFLALDDALEVAENVIKHEKEFLFDTSTGANGAGAGSAFLASYPRGLKGYYAEVIANLNTTLSRLTPAVTPSDSIELTFTDSEKTYEDAVEFIGATRIEMTNLANRYNNESNPAASAAYRTAAQYLEAVLKSAADDLEYVEELQSDSTIQPKIIAITEDNNIDTNLTYAQAISKAKGLNVNNHGTCNITKALNIERAVTYADSLIKSENSFWASEGEKAIELINKAVNGGTISDGDVKLPDNNNGGNKAPDTGVLAGEEGSASTTVAMVAGVATALTAAGAGVVAYRNARRSTRK